VKLPPATHQEFFAPSSDPSVPYCRLPAAYCPLATGRPLRHPL